MEVSNHAFGKFIRRCKQLRELSLINCSLLKDSSITILFRYCRDLQVLNLTDCKLISDKCFKELLIKQFKNINKPSPLVELNLSGCTNVIFHILNGFSDNFSK